MRFKKIAPHVLTYANVVFERRSFPFVIFTQSPTQRHTLLILRTRGPKIQDLLQDGKITVEEFKQAVQQCCMGRRYEDFPQAMKMFIDSNFKMVDLNDDGVIAADEYRFNCVTKFPIDDVEVVDEAFNNMLSVSILSGLPS